MATYELVPDGLGAPMLASLPIPFVAPGPTARDGERALGPALMAEVRPMTVTAIARPSGDFELIGAGSPLRLLLIVGGEVLVEAGPMRARLGPGDLLLVNLGECTTGEARLSFAGQSQVLDVELAGSWPAAGAVPPVLDEPRRSGTDRPPVWRIDVDGDTAQLLPFPDLFASAHEAIAQPVNGLLAVSLSPDMRSDWHIESAVNLVTVLAGGFELEVGGIEGSTVLGPGDVCLVGDTHGQGHRSRTHGQTLFLALSLPADHRWKRA